MKLLLPTIYAHFRQLLPNQAQEAVLLQKIILKTLFALLQVCFGSVVARLLLFTNVLVFVSQLNFILDTLLRSDISVPFSSLSTWTCCPWNLSTSGWTL